MGIGTRDSTIACHSPLDLEANSTDAEVDVNNGEYVYVVICDEPESGLFPFDKNQLNISILFTRRTRLSDRRGKVCRQSIECNNTLIANTILIPRWHYSVMDPFVSTAVSSPVL